MADFTDRTIRVLGEEKVLKLKNAHVAVFGLGGVGGHACEALVRAGIGAIDIIDNDTVNETNINRQIIALRSTIGRSKTEVMKERIADINPSCIVRDFNILYLPETSGQFDFSEYDYVVDAIDNVTAKIDLVLKCQEKNVPIISSMGTGNKLHPEMLEIDDIYKTSVCPLAKVMRKELKTRGVKRLKVVYSKEPAIHSEIVGSVSFVPGAAGLIMAGEVIRELVK